MWQIKPILCCEPSCEGVWESPNNTVIKGFHCRLPRCLMQPFAWCGINGLFWLFLTSFSPLMLWWWLNLYRFSCVSAAKQSSLHRHHQHVWLEDDLTPKERLLNIHRLVRDTSVTTSLRWKAMWSMSAGWTAGFLDIYLAPSRTSTGITASEKKKEISICGCWFAFSLGWGRWGS